jgi:uncharacterized YigZ family protein
MNAYKTLRNRAQEEYTVQKSRFIGTAAPVSSADGALQFLDELRKEHRGASHHCFAYIVGRNKGIIRYGDDGEPSGTAGKPIAEVMLKKDVADCAVAVTRYFGGILLGAGGLARAYAHAAALALDAARICTMSETVRLRLRIAYSLWDRIDRGLRSLPVTVENTAYAEDVKLSVLCRAGDEVRVMGELLKLTDGKIETHREDLTFFYPWDL